jgi:tRNA A-37 threonylcarbamoyl transferase component Bud32
MAKLELSLPYQQISSNGLWLLGTSWAIIGLSVSLAIVKAEWLFGIAGLIVPSWLKFAEIFLLLVGGLGYLYVPYQVVSNDVQGARIIVNKEGLGLPPSLLGIGASRWLSWTDIRKFEIARNIWGRPYLLLGLKSKGSCRLALSGLSGENLEQLLVSLEIWADKAVWSSKAIEFRDSLQNQNRGLTGWSYTQLWEEELCRHFNPTTFVPLEPGRKLRSGTLEIIRQLAFGGFSAIYVAQDQSGETVVLKEAVIPDSEAEPLKKKAMELFNREADLLAKLHHPQIARVKDHFIEEGRNYLVIEYVAGENLRQLVKRQGQQPQSRVIEWAKQMARILQYLHSQTPPIVHRDFTPDNIILKNDGSLVLIDFGAANQFLGNATGTLLGKPCYMAPEQVKGRAEPSSDLYALGGTLYFLLTANDPEAIAVAHPRSINDKVTVHLDEIVARLTAPNVKDRPGNATAVVSLLDSLSSASSGSLIKMAE